jgi:disulfide oxidoreductase YuzD
MKKTIRVKKSLGSKKVAFFAKPDCKTVGAWLKPGEKLKYDDKDFADQYLDKFGEVPYKKVFYNGQEGYIISEAVE